MTENKKPVQIFELDSKSINDGFARRLSFKVDCGELILGDELIIGYDNGKNVEFSYCSVKDFIKLAKKIQICKEKLHKWNKSFPKGERD